MSFCHSYPKLIVKSWSKCKSSNHVNKSTLIKFAGCFDHRNNEIKVQLIVTLNDLLQVTRICKLIPLKIIIVVLLKQIFEDSNVKGNLSEELKLAVVECFGVAFRKSTTDVKGEFYVPDSRALIGQIVFFCVNVIEKDTYKKLR